MAGGDDKKLIRRRPKKRLSTDPSISEKSSVSLNENKEEAKNDVQFQLFPRFSIYFVMLCVFWSRISMATNEDYIWLIHPDEVYQSIEVAHSEVYGYGFRPYEFLPPPIDGATNLTQAEARYASLGMHSMRSWIYPRVYQSIFILKEYFNITRLPPFYLAKGFHSAFSALLPLVVYRFSFTVYRDRDTAFISAVFVAFSSALVVLGTHTLIQSFISPIFFTLFTLIMKGNKENYNFRHLVCGLGLGLIVIIRLDYLILGFILTVTLFSYIEKNILFIPGFSFGAFVGGFSDYLNYGIYFISSRNWLTFQLNYAHKLFGSQPYTKYLHFLLTLNHTVLILSIFSLIFIAVQLFTHFFPIIAQPKPKSRIVSSCNRLWLASVYLLLIYSLSPHKEIRFIHDALVLVHVSLAGIALIICRHVYTILPFENKLTLLKLIVYGELLIYSLENRLKIPRASDTDSLIPWAYAGLTESGMVNRGLSYISNQRDVKGVVIDYSIHMTGAYVLLHYDVPIISKTHFEFREWAKEVRVNCTKSVRVSTIDRVTNFISVYNVPLLLKYVIQKPEYNYFLTTGRRRLPTRGFRLVFNASDEVRVYKRSRVRSDREDLLRYGDKLPFGRNSTVLEYESSWLITLELYEKAVERLEYCIELDKTRIRPWQLLNLAYLKMGQNVNADNAINRCFKLNGKDECLKKQEKVVLHQEYQLNV